MSVPTPNISTEAQGIVLAQSKGATCSCGHSVSHIMVGPEADYGVLDHLAQNVMGISRKPQRLVFRCRVCEEVILETEDPVVLASFH